MMSRRTEMLILLTILLFSALVVLFPIFVNQPYQTVTAVDYWSHATRMQQFDQEGFINVNSDWTNIFRIEGEPEYYPPGFPILLYSVKVVGNTSYYALSFLSLLFAPLFCLLIYLIPRKLLGSAEIGLLAAFLGACFISGSNMLGPTLPLASSLAVILLLFIFLVLFSLNNHFIKVLICSFLFGIIFMTHRASIGAYIFMLPFLAIFPIFLTKNRKYFLEHFHYPLLAATFLGLALSMIYWIRLPIDQIMTLAGILPEGIDEMLGFTISKTMFLIAVWVIALIAVTLYFIPLTGVYLQRHFEPVIIKKISTFKFAFVLIILPVFLACLLIWFIIQFNLSVPTSPGGITSLWGSISSLANQNYNAKVVKQLLYGWHWNVLPVLFIIPSTYLYLISNKRNLLLSISIGVLVALILVFIVQDVLFDVKVQRMYFYLSPFAFFITSWGIFNFLNDKKKHRHFRMLLLTSIVVSIIIVSVSSLFVIEQMSSSKIEGITWTGVSITNEDIIASTGYATQEARGLGQQNYVVLFGLFTLDNNYQLIEYFKIFDTGYIFIPTEMQTMNHKVLGIDNVIVVFSNGETNIYKI